MNYADLYNELRITGFIVFPLVIATFIYEEIIRPFSERKKTKTPKPNN